MDDEEIARLSEAIVTRLSECFNRHLLRVTPKMPENTAEFSLWQDIVGQTLRSFFEELGEWKEVQDLAERKFAALGAQGRVGKAKPKDPAKSTLIDLAERVVRALRIQPGGHPYLALEREPLMEKHATWTQKWRARVSYQGTEGRIDFTALANTQRGALRKLCRVVLEKQGSELDIDPSGDECKKLKRRAAGKARR